MRVAVGIDVAKEFHWVAVVLVDSGKVLLSQRVDNDPDSIDGLIGHLRRLAAEHGEVTAAIDLVGGVASLLTAMLLAAGIRLVHVSGLVVNQTRRLTRPGKMRYLRGSTADSKTLKFVFYQSAFCAIDSDPASKAFYRRAEGKRHHQALIALARRRINVLHAILRTRQPYQANFAANTATAA